MRRTAMVLVLFALAPFLMGAGGAFSPIPTSYVLSNDAISAFIVIDTHEAGVTATAKLGSIMLRDTHGPSQVLYAQGSFNVPADFALFQGCNPSLTIARFVGDPSQGQYIGFDRWMPDNFAVALFRQLGRTVDFSTVTNIPVITKVLNGNGQGECMLNPRETGSVTGPGWLFLEAEVRFAVPPKKP